MNSQKLDCGWCGSARSIEYGICQVCLMEYPMETRVIRLPVERKTASVVRALDLADDGIGVAE